MLKTVMERNVLKSWGFIIVAVFIMILPAYAIRDPRPTAIDSRIRVMVYSPNDVFRYIGYYSYQGSIEFEDGESVDTISMGDTGSWQIIPAGKRIFLKPVGLDATTNMTIITNKRLYFFELHAREAASINDPGLMFIMKFLYPETNSITTNITSKSTFAEPDLSDASKYNFNYTLSGVEIIAPTKVFDDGKFTYFEFRDNSPIPAFFEVDKQGNESLINYQVAGKYVILEIVASQFTLRYGNDITCVFNEP
jgi:type IV secretion system protein VirB9